MKNRWHSFEKDSKFTLWFSILWVVIICFVAFIWQLGSSALIDETEPLFAEAARQMTVTGDWITPYFNEETRFDKPPLVYWLMAIAYQIIGVNEWAARLPSALAAIGLVVFAFFVLRRWGFATPKAAQNEDSRLSQRQLWLSAWVGSALIALNIHILAWARTGVSDMLLTGCMDSSLLCFFWGYVHDEKQSRSPSFIPNGWYIAFYVLMALAVLAKGPVGLALPGIIILSFLIYLGNLPKVAKEAGLIFGFGLFFLITIPWYVLVIMANGQSYIDSFFGYHNIERFSSVVNNHSAPWYFYFLVVLVAFIPWSAYLPLAIARLRFWRRKHWQNQPRQAQLGLFSFVWFTAIFLFFTIAVTKLPSYTLPLIPAAAILVALLWSDQLTRSETRPSKSFAIALACNIFFLIFITIACYWGPNWFGYDPASPNIGQRILETAIPLRGLILWGLTAIACTVLFFSRHLWKSIIGVNIIAFLLALLFVFIPAYQVYNTERQSALKYLAHLAAEVKQPQDDLMMIGFWKPSLVFYSQHPVLFFSHTPVALRYLKRTQDNIPQDHTLLLISDDAKVKESNLTPKEYDLIAQKGNYQLGRVQRGEMLEKGLD